MSVELVFSTLPIASRERNPGKSDPPEAQHASAPSSPMWQTRSLMLVTVELRFNASQITSLRKAPCCASTNLFEAHRASTLSSPRPRPAKLNSLGLQCSFNRFARSCRVSGTRLPRCLMASRHRSFMRTRPVQAFAASGALAAEPKQAGMGRRFNVDHSELHRGRACSLPTMLGTCNLARLSLYKLLWVQLARCGYKPVQAIHPVAITETAWSG